MIGILLSVPFFVKSFVPTSPRTLSRDGVQVMSINFISRDGMRW